MNTFAERLKSVRESLGVSQIELAQSAGITRGALSKLENDPSRSPNAETLMSLAETLSLSAQWLLSGKGPKTNSIPVDTWDSETPLNDLDVEIDFYPDVFAAAGDGRISEEYPTDRKIRFPLSSLRKCGVDPSNAGAAKITGDSNSPLILSGMTVGFDKGNKRITKQRDFFWVNTPSGCKAKLASKSNKGILLESFNSDKETYPDTLITIDDFISDDYNILGRIWFWTYLNETGGF